MGGTVDGSRRLSYEWTVTINLQWNFNMQYFNVSPAESMV